MKLYTLTKPSPKERLIIREMKSLGYNLYFTKVNFVKYKQELNKIRGNLNSLVAFTSKVETIKDIERIIVISESSVSKYIRLSSIVRKGHNLSLYGLEYPYPKCTFIEIMIHELTHAILYEDHIFPLSNSDYSNLQHGIHFMETYSELCDKYKIRYPNPVYYLNNYKVDSQTKYLNKSNK